MGDEMETWEDERPTSHREVEPSSIKAEERQPVLQLVEGPGAPRDFPLVGEEIVVGRSSRVTINIATKELAPKQLRLTWRGADLRCEDLAGGLVLNGVEVRTAVLKNRDVLEIGSVKLYYLT